jgi:molecular chaperone DnaJ
MPSLGRGRRGDQRVVLNVVVPRKLSAEQRELLERFDGALTEDNLHERESVMQRLRRALR